MLGKQEACSDFLVHPFFPGENQGGSLVQLPKDDLETKKVSLLTL